LYLVHGGLDVIGHLRKPVLELGQLDLQVKVLLAQLHAPPLSATPRVRQLPTYRVGEKSVCVCETERETVAYSSELAHAGARIVVAVLLQAPQRPRRRRHATAYALAGKTADTIACL
jgi:hypothetical protein